MPSYNQARFIEEAICSIFEQGYPDVELIVIDGGSSDQTASILQKYDKRIAHWVSEPDRGQAHAINKGLDRATGDIIGWLNSDDKYVLVSFKDVAEAFRRDANAIVVHGNRILVDEDSHVSGWSPLPSFDPRSTGFIVCSETAFWRFSSLRHERLREDLRFAMDLEFFSRLYLKAAFVKLEAFLGYFRCYKDNKSSTIPEIGRQEAEREWKRLFGPDHEGWRNSPPYSFKRQISALFSHPQLIAGPYMWRRLRGRRGL